MSGPGGGAGVSGPPAGGPDGSVALEALTYEQLVATLEDLTRRMSEGEVGIEEVADLYEQAGAVHRAASERLARIQARLAGLTGDGEAPRPGGEG
ncbi:MAG: exodeoxyribonuclease VII small subunit [Acidimicrobiales bacterium]